MFFHLSHQKQFSSVPFSSVQKSISILFKINSLDFTFRRFVFKLFRTSDIHVVNYCASMFAAKPPTELLGIRRAKFLSKFDLIGLFS